MIGMLLLFAPLNLRLVLAKGNKRATRNPAKPGCSRKLPIDS